MRIAYVTIFDATDIKNWSGLDRHIWESLAAQGCDIELVGNLRQDRSIRRKFERLWGTKVERRVFLPLWNAATAKGYARDVERRIAKLNVDVVLSPSPIPLAFLNCPQPRFLWTDATFSGLLDFYPEFYRSRLCTPSVRSGLSIDRAVHSNVAAAVYSSDWAAEVARRDYGANDRIKMVPFGANVQSRLCNRELAKIIDGRSRTELDLLFMGVDWERKGGAFAVEVATELHRRRIPVKLTLVGVSPAGPLPPFVESLGFISKDTAEGRARVHELLRRSHFLLLPSRAECCAVVLAEACAFALPSAATRVGGIPTVVRDDMSGRTFGLNEPAETWADWIGSLFADWTAYVTLARSSYSEYRERLNWETAGAEMLKCIRRAV